MPRLIRPTLPLPVVRFAHFLNGIHSLLLLLSVEVLLLSVEVLPRPAGNPKRAKAELTRYGERAGLAKEGVRGSPLQRALPARQGQRRQS
jgi:hypothetical protein